MANRINALVWRAIFTVAYTLTVLPFTVGFFKRIASPSTGETLIGMLSLVDAHNLMLPIFLAVLEFASISLASAFWVRPETKILILSLFLACQSFAVGSVYFDTRARDYQSEKAIHEDAKAEVIEALRNSVRGLKEQISDIHGELIAVRKERDGNSNAIRQLLRNTSRESAYGNKEAIHAEVQDRTRLREKRENEIDVLSKRKTLLQDALRSEENELETFIQAQSSGVEYRSELEYIVKEFFSDKSIFAGFVAALFPVSILAVAFVLPKNSKTNEGGHPSFDLQAHLSNAASLPEEMHYYYARMLVPAVGAYLLVLEASKKILNENDTLNLRTLLIRQMINEVNELQRQVTSSKLEEKTKSYLLGEFNKLLNQQLTTKEE